MANARIFLLIRSIQFAAQKINPNHSPRRIREKYVLAPDILLDQYQYSPELKLIADVCKDLRAVTDKQYVNNIVIILTRLPVRSHREQ